MKNLRLLSNTILIDLCFSELVNSSYSTCDRRDKHISRDSNVHTCFWISWFSPDAYFYLLSLFSFPMVTYLYISFTYTSRSILLLTNWSGKRGFVLSAFQTSSHFLKNDSKLQLCSWLNIKFSYPTAADWKQVIFDICHGSSPVEI